MGSASFLALCFLALWPLLCSTSEPKVGRFDKQQLQQFKFQPSELAKLPWVPGQFGLRSSQSGFVRKLVADNSPIFRTPDWSHQEWMQETVRRSRTRADKIGALYNTWKSAFPAWLKSRAVDVESFTPNLVEEFAASTPIVSQGFSSQEYYLALEVGTPPQETLLIMDTGSELTWVECRPCSTCMSNLVFKPTRSTSYSVVSCSDAVCKNLAFATPSCDAAVQDCQFQIVYEDGSATVGNVATDVVAIHPVSKAGTEGAAVQKFALGCGEYTQAGMELGASGIMGLNRGPLNWTHIS